MFPNSVSDWIAFLSLLTPLTIATITAAIYVKNQSRDNQYREYRKFFDITDSLSKEDVSLISKLAAVYELRKYKEYKDVIIRALEKTPVNGDSAGLLIEEMRLTKEYLKGQS